MMRFATFSIAGSFLAAVLVMAMWPDNARFGTPAQSLAQGPSVESSAEQVDEGESASRVSAKSNLSAATMRTMKTEQVLQTVVEVFEYEDELFSDVADELTAKYDLNWILSDSAASNEFDEDTQVNTNLRNVSLAKALDLLLSRHAMTYSIDEGVLVVISEEDADTAEFMRVKMFDCHELLAAIPLPSYATKSNKSAGAGSSLNDSAALAVVANSDLVLSGLLGSQMAAKQEANDAGIEFRQKALLDVIRTMVNTDCWAETGGVSEATMVNGVLVVKASEKTLRDVDNLLVDLRANLIED